MTHPQIKRRQSGFTLIEIAIVLVIIGLLLGGILKGQELINNARVKNLASDFRNIPVFIYGYQDKFKALPGDDIAASTHMANADNASTGGTLGNGRIEGAWDSTTDTDESFLFWQHVRLAGLAPGPTDQTALDYRPVNAVGSPIGIQSAAPFTGMTGGTYFICSSGISGKFAKQLDAQLDDGNTASGSMMAGTALPASIATASIVDTTNYTVCMGI
ncbi:prepilin-type N-terminal cleavage/methylation domain-containing protein [Thiobacillus sp.]|uniref:prepilin-type N-terminal cleavage/methylation domain-containing protein n=1 Tax=Thiobacillus sp. TaxID=924 RepID=UPI0025D6F99A|nr:prepilin-type N-terminal cleavage/methylation domain-containing protein [Thiobacillus sp.]MBT9539578.1 prepilin-type N-terminal cleavage/methylation domain-containing protein [Thiobacillus sp.]